MGREKEWIDISVPLRTGMVHYPGDPEVRIERVEEIASGAAATVSKLDMGAHTGTHIDAPLHFIETGTSIDVIPFDAIVTKARVIEIADHESIKPSELATHGISPGEVLLFKTRNSVLWKEDGFNRYYCYLSTPAAALLVSYEVKAVGIDYLSVGGFEQNETEAHRTLLEASVWIIEGLDLTAAPPGPCDLICLPLKIAGGEAAPARAIIRPL